MSQKYNLKQIKPQKVEFSEFNPRGEKPAQIESDPTFEQLKESVYRYGVLVPIVVHHQEQDKEKPYRLVDGERRLRAALITGVKVIPAHVATKDSDLDDLVQAFHIHMLRKQWKAIAQARALKKIIEKLNNQGKLNKEKESELLEELSLSTGCTETRLRALRRAIRFPENVLKSVDEGKLNWSHLIQIEESFIEAVKTKFPDLLAEIEEKRTRNVLITKAQQKTLTSTRVLMDYTLPVITRASTKEEEAYAKQLLKEFIDIPSMPAERVLEKYEEKFPSSGKNWSELGTDIINSSTLLTQMLDRVNSNMAKEYPQLTRKAQQSLQRLRLSVGKVLRIINRVTD